MWGAQEPPNAKASSDQGPHRAGRVQEESRAWHRSLGPGKSLPGLRCPFSAGLKGPQGPQMCYVWFPEQKKLDIGERERRQWVLETRLFFNMDPDSLSPVGGRRGSKNLFKEEGTLRLLGGFKVDQQQWP